jgi:hypothetical protein
MITVYHIRVVRVNRDAVFAVVYHPRYPCEGSGGRWRSGGGCALDVALLRHVLRNLRKGWLENDTTLPWLDI